MKYYDIYTLILHFYKLQLFAGAQSQLQLKLDEDGEEYIEYTERFSKNHKFGLKSSRMEPKITRVYGRHDDKPERCVIHLLKQYIHHRPESHGQKGEVYEYDD